MRIRSIVVVLAVLATTVVTAAVPAGAAVVTCDGEEATLVGTLGPDILRGTAGDDVIVALAGNDRVFAGAGNDLVCAGPGNDWVKGQGGIDILLGGPGSDVMFGNAGLDLLSGGDGNDVLWGGVGPDELFGGRGNDLLNAGHGNDNGFGGPGKDKLNGSTGADELQGGQGDDVLTGGKGFDVLGGNEGDDLLTGGLGDDFIAGGPGFDRCRVDRFDAFIDCQSGNVSGDAGRGAGEFAPNLDPEFVIPSPSGPSYVLHIDAGPLAGQTMNLTVKDANGGLLFEGTSADPIFSNVLIAAGVPALVEITGAEFWSLSFLKTKVLFRNRVFHADSASEVFEIAPSLDGLPQPVTINAENTGTSTSVFQLVSIGDEGIILELDDLLVPGEAAVFTGTIRASAVYVAILSGTVIWDFSLVESLTLSAR